MFLRTFSNTHRLQCTGRRLRTNHPRGVLVTLDIAVTAEDRRELSATDEAYRSMLGLQAPVAFRGIDPFYVDEIPYSGPRSQGGSS